MRAEDFYLFMRKREAIRQARLAGKPWPWTDDLILRDYKFTNVKRLHDRTTQEFKRWYDLCAGVDSPEIDLLNCGIARFFGHAPFVIGELGFQHHFDPAYLKRTARMWQHEGGQVFTGAYIITNGGRPGPKYEVVVDEYITGLWKASDEICEITAKTWSWEAMLGRLMQVPGFGGSGFMAKEVALDTMLTPLWVGPPKDRNTWCPAGPGARRGLNRVFGRPVRAPLKPAKALEEMLQLFHQRSSYWPRAARQLGSPLELHDIQFQLCEFDKYERVRLGEGRPRSLYRPPEKSSEDPHPHLPPHPPPAHLGILAPKRTGRTGHRRV